MKKVISIFAMLLMVSAGCGFAQNAKKDVKKAYSKSNFMEPIESSSSSDFDIAIDLIELALKDETTKNDPYTWWVAAHIYDQIVDFETKKAAYGIGSTDVERQSESANKAYDYYLQAVELEKIPDAKGKISTKYTKKAKDMLIWYFGSRLILNYGWTQYQDEDYKNAAKTFEKHLSIPDLEFIAGTKECPKKDSAYYQVQYLAAAATQLSDDEDGAIKKYEATKNNGYRENNIYQILYGLYETRGDSANMMRIVDEGVVRFPQEIFYLGKKINYYIETNNSKAALEYLDKAIAANPANSQYYTIKGNILKITGSRVEAAKAYEKALELDPKSALAWNSKGEMVYQEAQEIETAGISTRDAKLAAQLGATATAKYKEAQTYFEKAVELNDAYLEALQNLQKLYYKFDGENSKNFKAITEKIKELR